jgi:uncharacterized membrane protein YgcG
VKFKAFFQALGQLLAGAVVQSAIFALFTACAVAAGTSIQDGAQMFSPATVSALDAKIDAFNAQTGKQIVVVTTPSLNGKTAEDAAHAVFQQQSVNGVLIFIAKDDRADWITVGKDTAQFFPDATLTSIRQSMESLFKAGDYDGGITSAVDGTLDVFRAHLASLNNAGVAPARNLPAVPQSTAITTHRSGVHFGMFGFILIVIVGFLILRSIFRSMGPRYYGPGPGVPPPGGYPPGPGYGGYGGYGPGYYGGGGGGFWSGLLGGLGGAWLGNEMFGNRGYGDTTIINEPGTNVTPTDQGGSWGGDSGGWGNDAGQIGGGSGGDWSGGGFGDGGGGFGGGGDSGGGW